MTPPDSRFYPTSIQTQKALKANFIFGQKKTPSDDYTLFEAAHGISVKGNREPKTALQRTTEDQTLAARFARDPELAPAKSTSGYKKTHTLVSEFTGHIRPLFHSAFGGRFCHP
ncbi:MAG: hypothetical protein GY755_19560 [Chloroflexi bacterium]|nr:hypothetical protein [Chloroflexota bacterium]